MTVSVDADAGDEEEQFVTLTHSVVGGDYHHAVDVPSVSVTIPVEGAPGQPRSLTAEAGNGQARHIEMDGSGQRRRICDHPV